MFNDNLNKDPLHYKFRVEFENNNPPSKDTHIDDIMSYNDILDYVESDYNNENGQFWEFRNILNHSLISEKKEKDDRIKI